MSGTGVLVTMHGAGLMNEVFLPPGAAVIEVFPPHVKHVLYEQMAHNSGIHHFKVCLACRALRERLRYSLCIMWQCVCTEEYLSFGPVEKILC